MIRMHNLGFPRIGAKRELKQAVDAGLDWISAEGLKRLAISRHSMVIVKSLHN